MQLVAAVKPTQFNALMSTWTLLFIMGSLSLVSSYSMQNFSLAHAWGTLRGIIILYTDQDYGVD